MDLIFAGIQGSGKGTQAKRLAAEYNYYIFEAGAELRAIAATDTELGKEVASYVYNGQLVPAEIIINVAKVAVLHQPADQKILFDGIPRDMDQFEMFTTIMQELGRDYQVIHFLLEEEQAVARIASRAKEQDRVDDADEKKVRNRLSWFFEKNIPVINAFKAQGRVTEVDANRDIETIYTELVSITQ